MATIKYSPVLGQLVLIALLCGCSTFSKPSDIPPGIDPLAHVVRINPQGRLESDLDRVLNGIRRHQDAAGPGTPLRLLLFVHGGLNSYEDTDGRVLRHTPDILESGYYPVFLSWNSGLWSSYGEHLVKTRQGLPVRWFFAYPTLPFIFFADSVGAVARTPIVWTMQGLRWFEGATGVAARPGLARQQKAAKEDLLDCYRYVRAEYQECIRSGRSDCARGHENVVAIYSGRDRRTLLQKSYAVGFRVVASPIQLLSASVIDMIGRPSWEVLNGRIERMFRQDPISMGNGRGGLTLFLDRLQADFLPDPQGPSGITLLGHSMGAIVVNDIVQRFPRLPIHDVVYMASADSAQNSVLASEGLLERSPKTQIYHLVLHERAEAQETSAFLGLDGSLLTWIDDFLYTPRTVSDRRAGRYENLVVATARVNDKVKGQLHLLKYGIGDSNGGPVTHSGFTQDMPFWKRECWQPSEDALLHDGGAAETESRRSACRLKTVQIEASVGSPAK